MWCPRNKGVGAVGLASFTTSWPFGGLHARGLQAEKEMTVLAGTVHPGAKAAATQGGAVYTWHPGNHWGLSEGFWASGSLQQPP